jgi:MarR family transcriptional regulator, negative regulator of the multidrug operon emrRAB
MEEMYRGSQVVKLRRDARLANLLGTLATGITDAISESTIAAADLDGAAPAALIALLDFVPSGSVLALSQVVGLTHSGAVRLVDRLVADGLVTRGSSRDGRARSITLTASGTKLARRVRVARDRVVSRAIEQLTDNDRATLTTLCERLITDVTRHRLEQRRDGDTPAGGALCRMCDFRACGREKGNCPAAEAAGQFSS